MSTLYYCWFCGGPANTLIPTQRHYETDRILWFCGFPHMCEYLELARL